MGDKLLEELQAQLDAHRAALDGGEEWHNLIDDKSMKTHSLKYKAYMKSASYRHLRNLRIFYDGGKCTKCGTTDDLQFHHTHYNTLFHELLTDGKTLCKKCHSMFHKSKDESFVHRDFHLKSLNKEAKMLKASDLTQINQKKHLLEHKELIRTWLIAFLSIVRNGADKDAANIVDKEIGVKYNMPASRVAEIRLRCGAMKYSKKWPKESADGYEPILSIVSMRRSVKAGKVKDIVKFVDANLDLALDSMSCCFFSCSFLNFS